MSDTFIDKSRMESLVDGIFSVSMTILVLTINFPQGLDIKDDIVILKAIEKLIPQLIIYFVAFALIGIFWCIYHSRFRHVKRLNNTFIWINLFWLMFIALMPFSTSLNGDYPMFHTAVLMFHVNFLVLSFLLFIMWEYVSKNNLIDEKLDPKAVALNRNMLVVMVLVCLFALIISFFSPSISNLFYFLIFPGILLVKRF
jgi:uncharacterized membrane protein